MNVRSPTAWAQQGAGTSYSAGEGHDDEGSGYLDDINDLRMTLNLGNLLWRRSIIVGNGVVRAGK
jgi:hypothetical protein